MSFLFFFYLCFRFIVLLTNPILFAHIVRSLYVEYFNALYCILLCLFCYNSTTDTSI